MPTDFKKTQKELYQPGETPSILDVPEMTFIMLDGRGDPNAPVGEYAAALEVLYGLAYTIKMGNKAILEYVVPPLEGLWRTGGSFADKRAFQWTSMIRQPDFVTPELFETARAALAKKKPALDVSRARLEKFTEGLCAQVLHVGPYDGEPATLARLARFIESAGARGDLSARRHHEIYLGDPRKTAPERLKTVLRHPIAR